MISYVGSENHQVVKKSADVYDNHYGTIPECETNARTQRQIEFLCDQYRMSVN